MTHDQIVDEVMSRARSRGLLVHYCKRGERCEGDKGLPDVLLAGRHGTAWAEVKTPACPTLSSEQSRWRYTLAASGARWFCWHEADLRNGNIDQVIHHLSTGIWTAPEEWRDSA